MINISRISEQDNQKMMDWVANIRNPETKNKILFITGERGSGKTELSLAVMGCLLVCMGNNFIKTTTIPRTYLAMKKMENKVVVLDGIKSISREDSDFLINACVGVNLKRFPNQGDDIVDFSKTILIVNAENFDIPADLKARGVFIETVINQGENGTRRD